MKAHREKRKANRFLWVKCSGNVLMQIKISLDKDTVNDLMDLTGEKSLSRAIHKAIEAYVTAEKLAALHALRGRPEFMDNDALESIELEEFS